MFYTNYLLCKMLRFTLQLLVDSEGNSERMLFNLDKTPKQDYNVTINKAKKTLWFIADNNRSPI